MTSNNDYTLYTSRKEPHTMPLALRGRPAIGPFRINYGRHGITSIALAVGPFTYNLTRRQASVDLPGPLSWKSQPRGPRRPGSAFTWGQVLRVAGVLSAALGIPLSALALYAWHIIQGVAR